MQSTVNSVIRTKTHVIRRVVAMPFRGRSTTQEEVVTITLPHVTFIDGPYQGDQVN